MRFIDKAVPRCLQHPPLVYNLNVGNIVPFKHRYELERHFARHGQEFNATTAEEYEELADEFMTGALRDGAEECVRNNGDLVRFDSRTSEFGIRGVAGYIRTFMIVVPLPSSRQTARQYYLSVCG